METPDIALLQAENANLKKVIAILIEQNESLKAEIAIRNLANTGNNVLLAFSKMTNGNPNVPDAFPNITKGNPNDALAFSQITNDNTKSPDALRQMTNGNPNVPVALSQITNGNTENPQTLPHLLPLSDHNLHKLYKLLKAEVLGKVHFSSVTNASKLLLHFYNKSAGDYTTLRKLTGLSNFGLAKYLRSLKKRGLIERDGWQKFKVTAKAVAIIQKAGCTG